MSGPQHDLSVLLVKGEQKFHPFLLRYKQQQTSEGKNFIIINMKNQDDYDGKDL